MEKFPDHIDAPYMAGLNGSTEPPVLLSSTAPNGHGSNGTTTQRLAGDSLLPIPRSDDNSSSRWVPSRNGGSPSHRHSRHTSLTDAFRNLRHRRGSVSQNAHELADALRAPLSPKLIVSQGSTRDRHA